MDLMAFDDFTLYFETPLAAEIEALMRRAGDRHGEAEAESLLLEAERLAPDHPVVLVGLYRYYFYGHRLVEAMAIGERLLRYGARQLALEGGWETIDEASLAHKDLATVRLYLNCLKALAYLHLRRGTVDTGLGMLEKISGLDSKDHLGAKALLDVARASVATG